MTFQGERSSPPLTVHYGADSKTSVATLRVSPRFCEKHATFGRTWQWHPALPISHAPLCSVRVTEKGKLSSGMRDLFPLPGTMVQHECRGRYLIYCAESLNAYRTAQQALLPASTSVCACVSFMKGCMLLSSSSGCGCLIRRLRGYSCNLADTLKTNFRRRLTGQQCCCDGRKLKV